MKKFLAFALVLVMCLAITSCGASEKEELYDKYEKVIEALEDKDYEEAVGEIYELYQKDEEETEDGKWGGSKDDEDETEEEKIDPEIEAMKAAIPGEWIPTTYAVEDKGLTNMTFNEDGTVTVNDESYTWEIKDMYSTYGNISIKTGDTDVYTLSFSKYDDGSYRIGFNEYVDENSSNYIGEFYRAADYTKLEITAENWDNYFEIIETSEISKNAFGEAEEIYVNFDMVLKEEYGKVNDSISKTVLEYSYKDIRVKYSADLASGSYTMGGVVDDYADSEPYTSTTTLYNMHYEDDVQRYGMDYGSIYIDEFPEDEVWINKDFSIIRLVSTIYVYNTAE